MNYPTLPKRGYFQLKDTGAEVKKLQEVLNYVNTGTKEPPLKIDGIFGPLTEASVVLFQTARNLKVDKKFGVKSLATAKAAKVTKPYKAINWAVSISFDNSFTYGEGERAHRSGCYFCGTNTGPVKKKKEKKGEPHIVKGKDGKEHTYEKTYCCNTFITAAWAHGAEIKSILAKCKAGSCLGMNPSEWTTRGFVKVGTCKEVKFSDLLPGDVIMGNNNKGSKHHHVWMYIGGDRFVHSTGNTWNANSIITNLSGAKKKYETQYAKYNGTNVVRCK